MDLADVCIVVLIVLLGAHNLMLMRRVNGLMAALRDVGPVLDRFSTSVDRTERAVEMAMREHRAPLARPRSNRADLRSARSGRVNLVGRFFAGRASKDVG